MTKKQAVFLLFMVILGRVQAQVSLALQVPPAGVVQKSQLWNMVLVNGSSTMSNIQVSLTLLSTSDNNPVMTAVSRVVAIEKGARQLKYTDFSPVNYKYLSPAFNVDLRPDGFLPIGSYTACYAISRWVGDALEPLAEDCITLEVQPLSPPILNQPADQDTLDIRNPQFSWLPPAPRQLLNDLTYDVIVAKLGTGQTPLTAIQQNIPVYNEGRNRNNFLNYPASFALLDTGTTYAWCVIARNNNQFVAQSDVWTFTISNHQPELVQRESASYIKLQQDAAGGTAVCVDSVKVVYVHQVEGKEVSYSVRNTDNVTGEVIAKGTFQVSNGNNFLLLPAAATRRMEADKYYLIDIADSRNQHWGTRFQYQKSKTSRP